MLTLNVGCHYYILRANCRYILHDFQMKRKRGDIQYLVAVVKQWSHCETGSMMAVVSISRNKILCQKFKMTISQCESCYDLAQPIEMLLQTQCLMDL